MLLSQVGIQTVETYMQSEISPGPSLFGIIVCDRSGGGNHHFRH